MSSLLIASSLVALLGTALLGASAASGRLRGAGQAGGGDAPGAGPREDVGALVTEADGLVTVELGRDETGRLAAVTLETETVTGACTETAFALVLYLLPAGAELPLADPLDPDAVLSYSDRGLTLGDLEAACGMTRLGRWDLGASGVAMDPATGAARAFDTSRAAPEIRAVSPIDRFEAQLAANAPDLIYLGRAPDLGIDPTVIRFPEPRRAGGRPAPVPS